MMTRRSVCACVMVAVLALAVGAVACTPSAPTDSGVRGTVRIGPTAPVQRSGESTDQPYAADLVITDSVGTVVANVRSAANGTFSVKLTPGDCTIQGAAGSTPLALPPTQAFTVRANEFMTVTVSYDSGIR